MTGLAPAGDSVFDQPGFRVMLGEELGLAVDQLGGMGFEGFGDLCVQSLASAAQQAAVRRILHQRVLETLDCVGRRAPLEHELRGNKAGERGLQLVLGKAGDGTQQFVRELASDRGAGLRYQPHRRQAIEPRHK